jgi:predicted CopG family antitoxin
MKKITITLDDAFARRARIEAKNRRKSLSKFVRDLIEREIDGKKKSGLEAMEEFLSGPAVSITAGENPLPTRQEIYDERVDELVRRYERANLRNR